MRDDVDDVEGSRALVRLAFGTDSARNSSSEESEGNATASEEGNALGRSQDGSVVTAPPDAVDLPAVDVPSSPPLATAGAPTSSLSLQIAAGREHDSAVKPLTAADGGQPCGTVQHTRSPTQRAAAVFANEGPLVFVAKDTRELNRFVADANFFLLT